MPTFKQCAVAVATAILASVVAGIIGFLSAARLEISFDKLKDFDAANLRSYAALGTSVKFDLELSQPREFIGFWGENLDGQTAVRKGQIQFKNFKLNSRIQGQLVDIDDNNTTYSITGFYNTDRIVFSHRGPISGVGIYILNIFQLANISGEIFGGYLIEEDIKRQGSSEVWVTQCPFIMIERGAAEEKFAELKAAQDAFSLLRQSCTEFKMPQTL